MEKSPPYNAMLPNASKRSPSVQVKLPLSNKLSHKAKNAIVLPELKSSPLTSLWQLCDCDCQVQLDKKQLKVYKCNQVVLKGTRNLSDGLWDMPMQSNYALPPSYPSMHSPLSKKKTNLSSLHDKSKVKKKKKNNKLNAILRKK